MKFSERVYKGLLERSMSQNFDLGLSFDFMPKKGQLLEYFQNIYFYIT